MEQMRNHTGKWGSIRWIFGALGLVLISFPVAGQRAPLFKSEIQPVLEKDLCWMPRSGAKNGRAGPEQLRGDDAGQFERTGDRSGQAGAQFVVEDDRERSDADGRQAERRQQTAHPDLYRAGPVPDAGGRIGSRNCQAGSRADQARKIATGGLSKHR